MGKKQSFSSLLDEGKTENNYFEPLENVLLPDKRKAISQYKGTILEKYDLDNGKKTCALPEGLWLELMRLKLTTKKDLQLMLAEAVRDYLKQNGVDV